MTKQPRVSKAKAAHAAQDVQDQLDAKAAAAPNPGQTGPAQGFDPAVGLPDAPQDLSHPVEQDSHTGPAQEPVHRITEHVADPAGIAAAYEELGLKPDHRKALPKRVAKLEDAEVESLTQMVKRVLETSSRADFTDGSGRDWTIAYQVMNNQSVIAIQMDRDRKLWDVDADEPIYSTVISTAAFGVGDYDYKGMLDAVAGNVK